MSDASGRPPVRPPRSSDARTATDRKLGGRLLARLAEEGMHAERRGEQVVLIRSGSSVSLACAAPGGILADLHSSGAVECHSRAGRSIFTITPEGRARLRRENAETDPFASQHRIIEEREITHQGGRAKVRVNTREDPLDVFRRGRPAGLVGAAELEAGERLRRDIGLAHSMPQVTANWSRLVVDGAGYAPGLSVSETIVEARRRVDAAMRAVGPDFSGILMDVCGFSKGIETLEREHAFPLRSGKVVLGFALRELARHYGLGNVATGRQRTGVRHWGAEDYRPELQAG